VSPPVAPYTVGVDIGTTSVKALAVGEDGSVLARARIPHPVITTSAGRLEHDARRAWRTGPRRAYAEVTAALEVPPAGVCVASMVPSLTAVNRRGVPVLPGLLYGDERGQPEATGREAAPPPMGGMLPDGEGFFRWAAREAPDAAGYWPCQSVANHALGGSPAIDTAASASLGAIMSWGKWNKELLAEIGVADRQLPTVVPMCEAGGTLPGGDTVFAGGTVDALCDQIVSGASEPGDILAVLGATAVIWVVAGEWREAKGLISIPHTVADRFLIGGPSNAGALFVDWVRRLVRYDVRKESDAPVRPARPGSVPVWLPYLRGERTPYDDRTLRASAHGLDISHGADEIVRGAYEATGFVIRRMLEMSGVSGRRVVASGGGTRSASWMAGVADAIDLPVDVVRVPEGAGVGAAFIARMAAGLESSLDASARWAGVSRTIEPDPVWAEAANERYARFAALGSGA
jgi:xylulokinase